MAKRSRNTPTLCVIPGGTGALLGEGEEPQAPERPDPHSRALDCWYGLTPDDVEALLARRERTLRALWQAAAVTGLCALIVLLGVWWIGHVCTAVLLRLQ